MSCQHRPTRKRRSLDGRAEGGESHAEMGLLSTRTDAARCAGSACCCLFGRRPPLGIGGSCERCRGSAARFPGASTCGLSTKGIVACTLPLGLPGRLFRQMTTISPGRGRTMTTTWPILRSHGSGSSGKGSPLKPSRSLPPREPRDGRPRRRAALPLFSLQETPKPTDLAVAGLRHCNRFRPAEACQPGAVRGPETAG